MNIAMSEKARSFAEIYDIFCVGQKKIVQVSYNPAGSGWKEAVEVLTKTMSEEISDYMTRTGETIDAVKEKIEKKLCAACEEENDQPEIFPM